MSTSAENNSAELEESFELSPSFIPYVLGDFPDAVDCPVTQWHINAANDQLRQQGAEDTASRFLSERLTMADRAFTALSDWQQEAGAEYKIWSQDLVHLALHHQLSGNPTAGRLIHSAQARNDDYYTNLCQIDFSDKNQSRDHTQHPTYEACAQALETHSNLHREPGFVCEPTPYTQ